MFVISNIIELNILNIKKNIFLSKQDMLGNSLLKELSNYIQKKITLRHMDNVASDYVGYLKAGRESSFDGSYTILVYYRVDRIGDKPELPGVAYVFEIKINLDFYTKELSVRMPGTAEPYRESIDNFYGFTEFLKKLVDEYSYAMFF